MKKNEFMWLIILGCFAFYFIKLFQTNEVMLFIHPRMYILVFMAMLVFAVFFILQILKVAISDGEQKFKLGNLLFIVPIVLVIVIQPKGLNTTILANDEVDIMSKTTFGNSDRREMLEKVNIEVNTGDDNIEVSVANIDEGSKEVLSSSVDNESEEPIIDDVGAILEDVAADLDGNNIHNTEKITDVPNIDETEESAVINEVAENNEPITVEVTEVLSINEQENNDRSDERIEVQNPEEENIEYEDNSVIASEVSESMVTNETSELNKEKEIVASLDTSIEDAYVVAADVNSGNDSTINEINEQNQAEETEVIEFQMIEPVEESIPETTVPENETTKTNITNLNEYLVAMGIEEENEQYYEILRMSYEEMNNLVGKEVSITAFVYKDEQFGSNRFYAGRLIITCCAACAQMDGFICEGQSVNNLTNDDWVQLTGVVETTEHYSEFYQETIVVPLIKITELKKISVPSEPYVYFKW